MRPELKPPGKTSDGWSVILCEERGPGRVLAGTGATELDALKAAYRETAIVAGLLAHAVIAERSADPLERLHQVAALFLAGDCSKEALAEACAACENHHKQGRGPRPG